VIFYQDNHVTLYCMDFRRNDLPDESVQCVVTSPPYWGLRKYSGEQDLIWGGDKDCPHNFSIPTAPRRSRTENDCPNPNTISAGSKGSYYNAEGGNTCSLCGAWKGAYGLEPTPEMYVQHTIEILREIRRVLRKDGVVFWNIGDSYWGGKGQSGQQTPEYQLQRFEAGKSHNRIQLGGPGLTMPKDGKHSTIKPKDLCLIPFRVAIAAQEDGWWVRSVIIWSKPNPMPESVTDRPTESHEYILMLTKSARYYWDADAVRREYTEPLNRWGGPEVRKSSHKYIERGEPILGKFGATSMYREGRPVRPNENGANIRTVWEFPTTPYAKAHFAVFPEKLPEICIKASTPEVGCCSKCGAPWERIVEVDYKKHRPSAGNDPRSRNEDRLTKSREIFGSQGWRGNNLLRDVTTLGWQPTCKCNADKVPSIVLDPFAGAGTTLWVAKKLNRWAAGYEISEEYCNLTVDRLRQQVLL